MRCGSTVGPSSSATGRAAVPAALRVAALLVLAVLLTLTAPPSTSGQGWPSDPWLEEPVDDETFGTFLTFFEYDEDVPFEFIVRSREESEGIVRTRISFVSTPGVHVSAVLFRPESASWERRPAAVLLHGGIGAGKDAQGIHLIAAELVRGGFNVLAFDLMHFGERDTGLLSSYTEKEKHERLYNQPSTYLSFVTQTVKDAGRARDLLVEEMGADPGRIGLVGMSRGGQLASIVAGADERFRAVVVLYGGHVDRLESTHRAPACPANFIGRIAPRPLMMVNGVFDQDYDRERSVEPLHRLAGEPVEIRWVETGHTIPPPEVREDVVSWLRDRLAGG